MDLILAEQLLLLMLDDEKGTNAALSGGEAGLAGALLVELTAAAAVRVDPDGKLAAATAAPRHPLLREAHAAIAKDEKRRDSKGWVGRLPKELKRSGSAWRPRRARRAVGGAAQAARGLPDDALPGGRPRAEQALRERLRAVLLGEREPDDQDALLVALLLPYDLVRRLVPKDRRRQAKARAEEVADAGPAGDAVAAAVRDAQAAVMAGVLAATTASVAGSSGSGGGA